MKIKIKDKIYEVPPWMDESDIEQNIHNVDWCVEFFGEGFYNVAFEPYIILEDTEDGQD